MAVVASGHLFEAEELATAIFGPTTAVVLAVTWAVARATEEAATAAVVVVRQAWLFSMVSYSAIAEVVEASTSSSIVEVEVGDSLDGLGMPSAAFDVGSMGWLAAVFADAGCILAAV